MALSEFISINVLRTLARTTVAGFAGGMRTAQLDTAWQADRVASYTSTTDMTDAGIPSTHEVIGFATTFFSAPQRPARLFLGRRIPGVAQIDTVDIDTADAGTWTVTIDTVAYSFIASGASTEQEIAEGLRAQIALGGGAYVLSTVTAGVFTVTAQFQGTAFVNGGIVVPGAGVGTFVNSQANTAAEDIGDCVTACIAEDNESFYAIALDSRDGAEHLDAAAVVATTDKVLVTQSSDVADAAALNALSYSRVMANVHHDDGEYLDAGILGYIGGRDIDAANGMFTLFAKTLPGVTASTYNDAARTAIKAVGGNYYIREKGVDSLVPGTSADTENFDVQISIDWAVARLHEAHHRTVTSAPNKVPASLAGISIVQNALQEVCDTGVTAGHFLTCTVQPMSLANYDSDTDEVSASIDAVIQGALKKLALTFNVGKQ